MLLQTKLSSQSIGVGSRCRYYFCGIKPPIYAEGSCTSGGITVIHRDAVQKAFFSFAKTTLNTHYSCENYELSKFKRPLNKFPPNHQRTRPRHGNIAVISFSSSKENATTQAADAATNTNATDAATNVDGNLGVPPLSAQCIKPRAIFPWRHSPHPLPRLVVPRIPDKSGLEDDENDDSEDSAKKDGDRVNFKEEILESDYFKKGGPLGPGWPSPMDPWFRASTFASSMHVYGLPWYAIVLPWMRNEWIDEMEWSFCEAFALGVKGMIEDTYRLNNSECQS